MGMDYRVDRELGVLLVTAEGRVSDAEFLDFAERAARDPEVRSGVHELVDLSRSEIEEISSDAVREAVRIFRAGDERAPRAQIAIVAPSPLAFGLARMYQMLRSEAEIRVFRELSEARAWLGIPAAAS